MHVGEPGEGFPNMQMPLECARELAEKVFENIKIEQFSNLVEKLVITE